MTIDEAIAFIDDITWNDCGRYEYGTVPKVRDQVEEWLEELKDLRKWKEQEEKACDKWYNKAIDDMIDKVSESILWDILAEIMKRNIGASDGADMIIDYLQKIGEQLKGEWGE